MDKYKSKIQASLLIADDDLSIKYRPKFSGKLGSVTAAILLQQINFRWHTNKKKPFYKFKLPCDHRAYKKGQSWIEELGFSRKEFETALSKISLTPDQKKKIKLSKKVTINKWQNLVECYVDTTRMTWYSLCEERFQDLINELYEKSESDFSKSNNRSLSVKSESDFSYNRSEITTETNTEKRTLVNEKELVDAVDDHEIGHPTNELPF